MENTSTSAFARLLATENIRVCHSTEAETASFDVVDRVLTLPRWKDMSSNLYDMLIGHEVAHALWTPGDLAEDGEHLAAAVEIDPENPMRAMGFLNVIEDARIERLIKDKYPGIRRDFVLGYRWLWENMDLFQTVIEESGGISKMMLADRLNLHFKLGVLGHITVPFSHDERPFVERMEAATSWDDVMDITRDLYEHAKNEAQNQTPQEVQTGEGGEGGDQKGTVKSPETDQVLGSGLDELRDQRYRGSAADRVDVLPTPDLEKIIVSADEIDELILMGDMRYSNTDKTKVSTMIEEGRVITSRLFDEWLLGETKTINYLVKQFEMRKAADEHQRTMITKSGRLDTVKMINYKWSEDIFGKNTTVRSGKNHGFVFMLDWSGSMGQVLMNTIKQAISLAMFCQKINVPFDLYAFSTNVKNQEGNWDNLGSWENRPESKDYWTTNSTTSEDSINGEMHPLQLLHFLSSTRGRKNLMNDLRNLYHVAFVASVDRWSRDIDEEARKVQNIHPALDLGGTPLDESLVCLHHINKAFRARHGVQILNTVILTDGDGHSNFSDVIYNPRLRRNFGDHPSHITGDTGRDWVTTTNSLLHSLRAETGTNIIGIYLYEGRNISSCFGWTTANDMRGYYRDDQRSKDLQKQYARENFVVADGRKAIGYDEAYIINATTETIDDIDIPDDASHAKMRNAFVKGMAQRSMSRVLSNRLVDRIAC